MIDVDHQTGDRNCLFAKKARWFFEPVTCALCDVDDASTFYQTDQFDEGKLTFVRCNRCGLIYQNPCPSRESMANLFGSEEFISAKQSGIPFEKAVGYWDYVADERFRLPMARYRLHKLTQLTGGRKLRILKIACGTGTFLHVARQAGHEVTGVDLSPFFCAFARERYAIEMINDWFEKVDFGEKKFDVIAMWGATGNFHEPKLFYQKIWGLLKDDGYFLTNDIAFDSWSVQVLGKKHFGFKPPGLQFYPKRCLLRLLKMCNFRIVADQRDWQYTNLAKLIFFSRFKFLWQALRWLPLEKIVFRLPIAGGYSLICRKR